MKQIIRIICLISQLFGYAQKETNHWYFGENAGLSFSSGVAMAITDGQLSTPEGCASISDSFGNLLFYTDGNKVYNKNHQLMLNGTGLNGDFSSTQSAIIIPKPGTTTVYYIFTTDNDGETSGLQYSEINMNLDSGLGGVTTIKNVLLHSPITEKLTAVKHMALNEYWVLSHKWGNDEFIAYRITANGVNLNPIISATGTSLNNLSDIGSTRGQIKISPDGKKVAVARTGQQISEVQLFDFNAETGEVSNPITLAGACSPYGLEFSLNSAILYVTCVVSGILQFDITSHTASEIENSRTTITDNPRPYGALQLGLDGKIYVAEYNSPFLHIINNPNELGTDSNYVEDALFLENNVSVFGLPPFIQSFFGFQFQISNTCVGSNTAFSINTSQIYDAILWDFGDGTMSNNENPIHMYNSPGEYTITVSISVGSDILTQTNTVMINDVPDINTPVQLSQCDDDLDGVTTFNLNDAIPGITTNQDSESITFYTSEVDAINQFNPIEAPSSYHNQTLNQDLVWARVENSFGCFKLATINLNVSTSQIPNSFRIDLHECDNGNDIADGIATFDLSDVASNIATLFPEQQDLIIGLYANETDAITAQNPITNTANYQNTTPGVESLYVRVNSATNNDCLGVGPYLFLTVHTIPPLHTIAGQYFICDNNPIELVADDNYDYYLWSTGETTQSILVNNPGTYTITVSNLYNNLICSTAKTIVVTSSSRAIIVDLEIQDWTLDNNSILVNTEGPGTYEYSIDGTNYQDSPYFDNLYIDEYTIYVRDKNGCGITTEDIFLSYYPRFFTPNNDGKNDYWQIINASKQPYKKLLIFNRYGQFIVELDPQKRGWDGNYNGTKLPSNDYWFLLERHNGETLKGHFTLKR